MDTLKPSLLLAARPISAQSNERTPGSITRGSCERSSLRHQGLKHQNQAGAYPAVRVGSPRIASPITWRNCMDTKSTKENRQRNNLSTPHRNCPTPSSRTASSCKEKTTVVLNQCTRERVQWISAQKSLILVVVKGSVTDIRNVLASGADINSRDSTDRPILQVALMERKGDPSIIKVLLDYGARPEDVCERTKQNSIHVAARRGYQVSLSSMITALCRSGSSTSVLNARDQTGRTPVMHACRQGHDGIVRELLDYGADPAVLGPQDSQTALHEAVEGGSVACVEALLEKSPALLSSLDQAMDAVPILVTVAKTNQADMIDFLISHIRGPAIDAVEPNTGRTALHYAAMEGNDVILLRLLESGADINRRDLGWNTAFSLALAHHHRHVVELLIKHGCDIRVTDRSLNTAIHLAARDGLDDIVKILSDRGVDVNIKGEGGFTPLMLACLGGHVKTVRTLLEVGAELDLVNRNHATALSFAVLAGINESIEKEAFIAAVKLLIHYGADLDCGVRVQGLLKSLHMDQSKLLDVSKCEDRLYTPLELSFVLRQIDVFDILLSSGASVQDFHCCANECFVVNRTFQEYNCINERKLANKMLESLSRHRSSVRSLAVLCRKATLSLLSAYKQKEDKYKQLVNCLKNISSERPTEQSSTCIKKLDPKVAIHVGNTQCRQVPEHKAPGYKTHGDQTPGYQTPTPGNQTPGYQTPDYHLATDATDAAVKLPHHQADFNQDCDKLTPNRNIRARSAIPIAISRLTNSTPHPPSASPLPHRRLKTNHTTQSSIKSPASNRRLITLSKPETKEEIYSETELHSADIKNDIRSAPSQRTINNTIRLKSTRSLKHKTLPEVPARRSESAGSDDSGMCLSSKLESYATVNDVLECTDHVSLTTVISSASAFGSIESLLVIQ